MTISIDTPIGHIAAERPLATRVFARYGLDYCCGGGKPLRDACAVRDLDAAGVLAEILRETAATEDQCRPWADASPADLVAHIVSAFHDPLREELPRLEAMARKVARVHGEARPETLPALSGAVTSLRAELERHMDEEERDVFPAILQGEKRIDAGPLDALEDDHEATGLALARIRELTDDYVLPGAACTTWRALWAGLEDLEATMHEHVHLENHVLFPRVLDR